MSDQERQEQPVQRTAMTDRQFVSAVRQRAALCGGPTLKLHPSDVDRLRREELARSQRSLSPALPIWWEIVCDEDTQRLEPWPCR